MNGPASRRPRGRRWSSYSLRSLFILITLMAIGLAWVAYERRQSQCELEITDQLKASGALVVIAGLFDDQQWKEQSWWRRALGELLGPRIRSVNADRTQMTDLAPLAELSNLQELWAMSTPVTDLAPLVGLPHLVVLQLDNAPVSDLSTVAGLKNLQFLTLDGTQVTDLSPLAGLKNLKGLGLGKTSVSDLSPLAGLKNLTTLRITNSPVSDEQIKLLQQALPNCEIVR